MVIAATAVGISFIATYRLSMSKFQEIEWREGKDRYSPDSPRQRMAQDVIRSIALPGRQRAAIYGLLGHPEKENETEAYYFLGVSDYSISDLYLVIVFDAAQRVERAYLTRK